MIRLARLATALIVPFLLTGCGVESSEGPGSSVNEDGGKTGQETDGAGADVTVTGCKRAEFGLITANLSIKNSAGSAKTYAVTLSADGPGGTRVAELNGFANSIQPGQTAMVDAVGSVSGEAPEGLTCTVVNVNRF